jgi:hypothetical protein
VAVQHVGRNVKALLELVKAREPVQGVANNQDASPLAHALEAASDGAAHLAEAFGVAYGKCTSVTIMMQVTYLQNRPGWVCCFAPKPRHVAD